MPKGTNQKLKLYRLAQIMLENTDDEHYITMPEIMEELEQKIRAHYHIGAEGDVEENEEAATAEGITKEEE